MATGQVITNDGKKIILNRAYNKDGSTSYTPPTQFKVGTGTNTPDATDTDLQTPVSIDGDNFKDFEASSPVIDETALTAQTRCLLNTTNANGNSISEFGMVNEDGLRKLFSRAVVTAITKNNTTEITFIQEDTFT